MTTVLQNPALLGLLALAALPLLVHLLSRAKPPSYSFSNTEFLRRVLRLTSRLRRPKDWLLLAMRTLALLAIAAAFLGPILLSETAPLPGERRTIVCLIDRSGSMAASNGAASRFGTACAEAAALLDSARPELANVIWLDARPDAVFPDPGPNRAFLAEELSRATVRPEPNAIDAAFELAARQFPATAGRRELHVFSDFQASAWRDAAPLIPANVDLRLVPVATADVPNLSVSALVPVPASPVAGRRMLVQCRVTNHSDQARRVSLTLDAGGSRQSQPVELPPRGSAETAFNVLCSAPGLLPLTAEIDADAFTPDDRRHAVVRVRETLRMAIAAGPDDPAAGSLSKVAAALPWLDALSAADPENPPPCDLLVISGWSGANSTSLRELAESGTAVIVLPTAPSPAAVAEVLGAEPASEQTPIALRDDDPGWEIAPVADHPAFALFADGEFGNPFDGRFRQRLQLTAPASAEILARYADGVPALIADPDAPILLANLSLDPAKTGWPTRSSFLPAIAELILHLCPTTAAESFAAEPGEPLAWTDTSGGRTGAPTLEAPDGSLLPLGSSVSENGTTWHSSAPAATGIHRWLVSDQPVHLTAVNFPESESSLAPLPEPPALGTGETRTAEASRLAALDEGLPLWPWLIAAALALLLLESFVASLTPKPSPAR